MKHILCNVAAWLVWLPHILASHPPTHHLTTSPPNHAPTTSPPNHLSLSLCLLHLVDAGVNVVGEFSADAGVSPQHNDPRTRARVDSLSSLSLQMQTMKRLLIPSLSVSRTAFRGISFSFVQLSQHYVGSLMSVAMKIAMKKFSVGLAVRRKCATFSASVDPKTRSHL